MKTQTYYDEKHWLAASNPNHYTITTPCNYNHAESQICQPKFGFVRKGKKSELNLNHSISWYLNSTIMYYVKHSQILKNTNLFSAILRAIVLAWPTPAPSWPALCRPRTGRHFAGPVLAGTLPAVFWPALVFLSTADICLRKSSITEYLF